MRFGFLKKAFNVVAAEMPVIGPHSSVEAQLLLAGKKPLGWVNIPGPNTDPEKFKEELALVAALDAKVRLGNLKSADVVTERGSITRHYCQPQHEETMRTIAEFHSCIWNKREIPADLKERLTPLFDKDLGEHLGYRKRDVALWNFVNKNWDDMPDVVKFIYKVNEHITQPAYQEKMLEGTGYKRSEKPLRL